MNNWRAKSIAAVIALGALTGADTALAADPFTRLITKNTPSFNDNGLVIQDGSGVLFSTADSLVAADTDSQQDVYLNRDGEITYLTPDLAESVSLKLVGATDDASIIYVETTGSLVPEDTDLGGTDVYAVAGGTATLVSTSQNDGNVSAGAANFDGVAPDGSIVYFTSDQQFAPEDQDGGGDDVYAYRPNDSTPDATLVSTGDADAQLATNAKFCGASDNGNVVAFETTAQMTSADTDVTGADTYRRAAGTTKLASTGPLDPQTPGTQVCRGVSRDGTAVAFESTLPLFLDDDTNKRDVFTYDGVSTRWVSTSALDPATNTTSTFGDMSPDGDTVYFTTGSALLAADGDDADASDPDGYSVGPGGVISLLTGGSLSSNESGASIKAVSKDGSAVIFTSIDQYVTADADMEDSDLYARFNGGPVTLISTGPVDIHGSVNATIQFDDGDGINRRWGVSADGSVIGYNTQALLTSDDLDAEYDVYAYIVPKPATAAPPLPPITPADVSAPAITSAKLSNKTFAIDKKTNALSAAKTKKGTKISFSLSEAATVKLAFQSISTGRRSGSKCVKKTSKNRSAKPCTITKTTATARLTGTAGSNSKSFGGKIGSKTLKPGKYQLVITATDAAGNSSSSKPVKFTIVKS